MLHSLKRKQNRKVEEPQSPSNVDRNVYYGNSLEFQNNKAKPEIEQEGPQSSNIFLGKNTNELSHFIDVHHKKHTNIDVSNLSETSTEVMLTQEDFDTAGIVYQDLSNLSESQIQILIEIHDQKQSDENKISIAPNQNNNNFQISQVAEHIIQNEEHSRSVEFNQGNVASTSSVQNSHSPQLVNNGPPRLSPIVISNANNCLEEQDEQFLNDEEDTEEPNIDEEQQSLDIQSPDQITITITAQGHVKLTDSSQHTYFFSREELAERNIDASNLTDANITQIVKIAIPSLRVTPSPNKKPRYADEHLDQEMRYLPNLNSSQIIARNDMSKNFVQKMGIIKSVNGNNRLNHNENLYNSITQKTYSNISQTSTAHFNNNKLIMAANLSGEPRERSLSNNSQLISQQRQQSLDSIAFLENSLESNVIQIGDELEICRNGRNEIAVVRYSRPGEFKVQYSDGKFDWISENNVLEAKASKHRLNIDQPSTSQQQESLIRPKIGSMVKENHKVQILSKNLNPQRFLNEDDSAGILNRNIGPYQSKPILKMQKNLNFMSNSSYYESGNNTSFKRNVMLKNPIPSASSANLVTNIPGMRVTVPYQSNRQSVQTIRLGQYQQQPSPNLTANSTSIPSQIISNQCYCSLCDQCVPASQTCFIVLRVMACNSCASEKISIQETDPLPGTNCTRLTKEPLNSKVFLESRIEKQVDDEELIDVDDAENFLNTSGNSPKNLPNNEQHKKSSESGNLNNETHCSNCLDNILNPLAEESLSSPNLKEE